MIWFTSDLHLGHHNIIAHCGRPFDSTELMDAVLIENLNACAHRPDTLWILGDIGLNLSPERLERYMSRIACKDVRLVRGNHDKKTVVYESDLFTEVCELCEIPFAKTRGTLCHYPLVEWNRSHHGSFMLHGHQHNAPAYNQSQREQGIRRYDVGVDANGYCPVSQQMIMRFFGID